MLRNIHFAIFFALLLTAEVHAQVLTGLDHLAAEHFAPLKGKRVALITNQTGKTKSGWLGADLFAGSNEFQLVAFFAPEHGLNGIRQAGVNSDTLEKFDGIPVYSLYGSTRKPTKKMLKGIDALVFDIQDVGVRPYTYLSTMIEAMEAAAENNIRFYVLDRPNPLSGERVEGNIMDFSLESFIGIIPVPYLHGMTLGELAKMATAKGWFHNASKLQLTVIPMTGWKRSMYWNETGLHWTGPSPNVPNFANAIGLAMLGATGEFGDLSVGVGSDKPFLRIGSTLMPQSEIKEIVDSTYSGKLTLTPEDFTATTSAGTKLYHGVRIGFPAELKLIPNLYSSQYRMIELLLRDTGFRSTFDALPSSTDRTLDKVTGMHGLMDRLRRCEDLTPIFAEWNREDDAFKKEREPYLLYK